MKGIKFVLVGILFGIIMSKSEAISWYRIQEMFRFQSFHMFGIIGVAAVLGAIGTALIKKYNLKDIGGEPIKFAPKEAGWKRYLYGGTIFGLGWAMTGACPGPIFVSLGNGYWMFALAILTATLGTFVYGLVKDKLPH